MNAAHICACVMRTWRLTPHVLLDRPLQATSGTFALFATRHPIPMQVVFLSPHNHLRSWKSKPTHSHAIVHTCTTTCPVPRNQLHATLQLQHSPMHAAVHHAFSLSRRPSLEGVTIPRRVLPYRLATLLSPNFQSQLTACCLYHAAAL